MTLDLLNLLDGSMIVAADGDSEGVGNLGLILLLSGFIFYGVVYLRYRNTDKRHRHESETEATMLDIRAVDQQINTLKGVKNSKLRGANNREVRAGNRSFLESGMPDAVNDALRRLPGRPQL